MPDVEAVLKTTIEVNVDGFTFVFSIPSFADEIKLGLRAKQIRRELEIEMLGPNPTAEQSSTFTGGESTYDQGTETYVRTAAQFSILLKHSTAEWVASKNETGAPAIDYRKWPADRVNTILRAGVDFSNQLTRFRTGGVADPRPSVEKTVDSEQNPEAQPVQSGDT